MQSLPTSTNVTRSGFTLKGWTLGNTSSSEYISTSSKTPKLTGTANIYAQWTKNCSAGTYLPGGSATCTACPASSGTGYYCPGGNLVYNATWTAGTDDQGKTQCPPGYPNSLASNSTINKCYIYFKFYPGTNAVFDSVTYNSDTEYFSKAMYYKQDTEFFDYDSTDTSSVKHYLQSTYITGGPTLSRPKYTFVKWQWQNGASSYTDLTATTNITSGAYRNIYAKWGYNIQYNPNGGNGSAQAFFTGNISGTPVTTKQASATNIGTRTGYTFAGWCINSSSCSSSSQISAGSQICDMSSCATGNIKLAEPNNNGYVHLYARWTANQYTCSAGYYLPAGATECSPCTAGNYCPGGTFTFSNSNNGGLNSCPSSYPNSISQIGNNYMETWLPTSASSCYKTQTMACSTLAPYSTVWPNGTIQQYDETSGNLSSSATGTGIQFNDGTSNWHLYGGCGLPDIRYTPLQGTNYYTCDTGYTFGYVNSTYNSSDYTYTGWRCRAADDNWNSPDITGLAPGEWEAQTQGGNIKGTSACSFSYANILPTVEDLGGPECYCQATSFTPSGGSAQAVTQAWFKASNHGKITQANLSGTKKCETDCAALCGDFYFRHDSLMSSYMQATQCQPISYTVYFKPSGASGTISRSPLTCKYDQNCDLTNTGSGYYKTGYDFAGWKSGDAVNVYPNSTVIPGTNAVHNLASADGSSIYLYAQWTPTNYTIAYNLNDGTCSGGSCAPTSYNIESSTIALPTPTRLGYDFGGWYETSVFSGNAVATIPTGSYGNKTYYAKWTVKEINCPQGHYIAAGTDTCSATCPANSWCPGGNYVFDGTAKGINSCPSAYPHSDANSTSLPNCYATITYNLNGGSALQYNPAEWHYNANYPDYYLINPFPTTTKAGYTVSWWTTSNFQSGTQVDTTTHMVGDQVLYAKWTIENYTITYNLNDGACSGGSCTPTSYNVESADITLPTPTKTGYTFGGWYESADFTGNAVTTIATGSTGNKTYYAKWTADTINLTWTGGYDGSTYNQSNSCTYDGAITLPTPAPTRTGYKFDKWKVHDN